MGQVFVFALTAALNPTLLTGSHRHAHAGSAGATPDRLPGGSAGHERHLRSGARVRITPLEHLQYRQTQRQPGHQHRAGGADPAGRVRRRHRTRPTAARLERARRARNADKPDPRWRRQLSKGSARDTFVVGILLSFPGASYIAGMDLLHKQNTGTVDHVLLVLAFNAIMLILVELPLLGYAIAARMDRRRDRAVQQLADPPRRPRRLDRRSRGGAPADPPRDHQLVTRAAPPGVAGRSTRSSATRGAIIASASRSRST